MSWQMITSDDEVAALLSDTSACRAVVVDTEFMRRNTFYPQVALLQLCFDGGPLDGRALLIDPLTLGDTGPIKALLRRPELVKVLHSASEDLEVFQRWLGELPEPLFDTQRAAALVGLGFGLGYRKLVHLLCDVDLPKGETRSDWLQRPLSQSQCDYAAQDVTWLLKVWRELDARCRAQGKSAWVLSDGEDALRAARSNGVNGYYRRIKNAWKLDPRQLAALVAVCEWRESTARDRDKPRSWIIDDRVCLQLAQHRPTSRSAMRATIDIPPAAMRRYGDELLTLIAGLEDVPEGNLPERLPRPLDARQRDLVKRLKSRVRELAVELGASPEALLQGADYELLVRRAEGQGDPVPAHWQGWRRDRVIEPLRQELAT
jgi:ribonuclease D